MLYLWIQIFVNGVTAGLALAVFALGFGAVYVSSSKLHLSLCGIFTATPAVALAVRQAGMSWSTAVMCAIVTGVGLSLAVGVLNHERLERRGGSVGAHFVSALGVYLVITQVIVVIFGGESKMLRTGLDAVFRVGPVTLTSPQLLTVTCASAIIVCFLIALRWSRVGLLLRAASENPAECELRGINVSKLRAAAFAVAGALGAASSLLVANENGFDPNGGLLAGLPAIAALIIGGRSSFVGPILGAVLISMTRAIVVYILSAGWQEAVTFLLLAGFLILRPHGIIGHPRQWEGGL